MNLMDTYKGMFPWLEKHKKGGPTPGDTVSFEEVQEAGRLMDRHAINEACAHDSLVRFAQEVQEVMAVNYGTGTESKIPKLVMGSIRRLRE